ncbi:S8 family serine peptidase [Micromonospora radicis]|uniref:S8 family serine peptidase n=1 Tax=Micromonospora radicis TaxID=1894971 RepID=UPI0038994EE1
MMGLVLGVPGTATATPYRPEPPRLPHLSPGQPVSTGQATVTLITGDRVTVRAAGGASVRPGEGRSGMRFVTQRQGDKLLVIPQDALPLVRDGRVDPRLFDVQGLIAAGYDDATRANIPLILTYGNGAARRTAAPAGVTVTRDLAAVGAVAATADKRQPGQFWGTVTGGGSAARAATGGVERVWLDGKRKVRLEHSAPQIGAPAAHQTGLTGQGIRVAVLDTGVDAEHPDLVGRIADAVNFSEDEDPGDTVGHGTHVASTIAGSGAASGGRNRGVAPDATLYSGKVCEDYGCSESAILAGMQWAAVDKRAHVINMSLGGYDEPGIDPLEEAVDRLTKQTGALFVVAAGNDGGAGTVNSPASADAALAVGAVDRTDNLADFSSRGPRAGDGGPKPDITAPGVDILAARSKGTLSEYPGGDDYVVLSGTSMATPHVAGAAALLAQQHGELPAEQLKALLMASAKPDAQQTVFEAGAGRVDLARAITQRVVSEPASVSFGRALWPHDDNAPITRTVSWRNTGTEAVTLDLAWNPTGPGGAPAPAGMFTVSTPRVVVPAQGSVSVTVTADTSISSPNGHYSGRLVASSADTVVVTPLAVEKEEESYPVTIRHLGADGAATGDYRTVLNQLDGFDVVSAYDPSGTAQLRLPKGRYGVNSHLFDPENGTATLLVQPELVVDSATTLTIDTRQARPVRMTVPQRSATPGLVDVNARYLSDEYVQIWGILASDFTGLATGQLGRPVAPERFQGVVISHWADLDTDHSSYFYGVGETFPGRMPTGLNKHYRSGDLARVEQQFPIGYPGTEAIKFTYPEIRNYQTGVWGLELPTTVPGKRVEYFNTNSGSWHGFLLFGVPAEEGRLDWVADLSSDATTYQAGRTYQDTWNRGPYGPSFPAPRTSDDGIIRWGNYLSFSVPLHSDAARHTGGTVLDTVRTALYRNGKLVSEYPFGVGSWELPDGNATYRIESSMRQSFTSLSTEVSASWTFQSRNVGNRYVRQPASVIRFTPSLDDGNAAPAGRPFVIPIQVQRQTGTAAAKTVSLTVEVSYDGGTTWQQATVKKAGRDWSATLQHPNGAGHVSLRATAKDSAGNTVTQRITKAYHLK